MAKELLPQGAPVRTVTTENPVCVSEHTALEEAIALMRRYHVRRLSVVNEHKEVIGVLSFGDLLPLLGEEQHAIVGFMRAARRRRE
jgi:CBS domain-containing protein